MYFSVALLWASAVEVTGSLPGRGAEGCGCAQPASHAHGQMSASLRTQPHGKMPTSNAGLDLTTHRVSQAHPELTLLKHLRGAGPAPATSCDSLGRGKPRADAHVTPQETEAA